MYDIVPELIVLSHLFNIKQSAETIAVFAEKGFEMKKALCILLTVGTMSPAMAQGPQCGPKLEVATQLVERFGEVPIATGITFNNSMKFFGNPKTGSWSLIFIRPDGIACVLAAGQDLEVSSLAYAQNTALPSF
jgi:hypothetical protein